jgi:hypothetical protein
MNFSFPISSLGIWDLNLGVEEKAGSMFFRANDVMQICGYLGALDS